MCSSLAAEIPTLVTDRLSLRPFQRADGERVRALAGDWAIADKTLNVPHPYEAGMAEEWIATHQPGFQRGELVALAITLKFDNQVIGATGLGLNLDHGRGTLGYWMGQDFWGRGYCTEAAAAVVGYGFGTLGLNKIDAECLARNPASARVLVKLGMRLEGQKRQHYRKWGNYEDVEQYGLLRADYVSTDDGRR